MRLSQPLTATLLAAVLLTITACGPSNDRARIVGKFRNIDEASFYAFAPLGEFKGIDTIHVEGGKFTYEYPTKAPLILTILYPNFSSSTVIAEPGKTISIDGAAGKLGEMDISGSDANERLTKFRLSNINKPAGDQRLAAEQYIRDNAAHIDAVALFLRHFAAEQSPDARTALALLDVLRKSGQNTDLVLQLENTYKAVWQNSKSLPLQDFTAVTIDGKTVSKADLTRKPLLIVFWSGWTNESYPMRQKALQLHKANQERLNVLSVSLDTDVKTCREHLRQDSLTFPVVCDGLAFRSPLAQKLGVSRVPCNILTDASGKVVARDIPTNELEEKVEQVLK